MPPRYSDITLKKWVYTSTTINYSGKNVYLQFFKCQYLVWQTLFSVHTDQGTHPLYTHIHMHTAKQNFPLINLKISKCTDWEIPAYSASSMFSEIYKIWDSRMINLYKILISKLVLSLCSPGNRWLCTVYFMLFHILCNCYNM